MYGITIPIALIFIAAAIALSAVVARRRGHLQSRASQVVIVAVIAILAIAILLGPDLFPRAD